MGNKSVAASTPNSADVPPRRPSPYPKEPSFVSPLTKPKETTPFPKETSSLKPSPYPREPSTVTEPLKNAEPTKTSFYSTVLAANPNFDRTKVLASSSFNRWYRWRDQEIRPANNGKSMWYRKPVEIKDKNDDVVKETSSFIDVKEKNSNSNEIRVAPSFQLRTTAVPSATLRKPVEIEKIIGKDETPSDPNAPSATEISTHKKTISVDAADVPTYVSRGIQADLQTSSADPSTGIPIRYYERQPVKIVPLATLSNLKSNNEGFYHLSSAKKDSEPVLPPIEKTPVWTENGQNPVDLPVKPASAAPPAPPPPVPLPPPLPPAVPKADPLSVENHEKVVAEMRKQNQEVKDGTYRVKKIHFFEKLPWVKSGASKTRPKSSRAIESISRSEQLFFSQSNARKK